MQETFLRHVDARAKIIAFIAFSIIVVSTPGHALWAFVFYAALLAFVAGLARVRTGPLLRRLALVLPLLAAVAVFLPFAGDPAGATGGSSQSGVGFSSHDLSILWNTGAKAVLSIFSISLLGLTTTIPRLLAGFQALRAPRLLVLVVTFMVRYSVLFVDESRRAQRALASRNFRARWLGNTPVLGHMLGSLFVRSYTRGERVYLAMLSRGYDGAMPQFETPRFRLEDGAFILGLLGSAMAVRIVAGV